MVGYQSEFVNASLDDLDRLIDVLAYTPGDRGIRRGECDKAAILRKIQVALARCTEKAGQWLRQPAQLVECRFNIRIARDVYLHAIAMNGAPGEGNARLAKNAQHILINRLQLLLAHGIGIDLKQQARPTPQVETEHDVALRPAWPFLHHALGEEVRHREQTHDKRRDHDRRRLPPREKQHGP
jgi:hypothetical protein